MLHDKNIFSYGFSMMKNAFVKWASGRRGFRIEVTLRAGYGYRAVHTGSWAVRANKIPARAIFGSHQKRKKMLLKLKILD